MPFGKKKICAPRKSGNPNNKKHTTCNRQRLPITSKRGYIRNKLQYKHQYKQSMNINTPTTTPIRNDVFSVTVSGETRSEVAARVKKNRDINRLKNTILDKNLTLEQQALTLYSVLIDPDLETIIKLSGITINSTNTTISCFNEYMRKK